MSIYSPSNNLVINPGSYVVGLQPDDRMPNDWLRMVARVFTAYRATPLESSIVAYIDGLHLTKMSHVVDKYTVGISNGQCFIDDQFIGYRDDSGDSRPDSSITIDTDLMNVGVLYSIVLCYTWINIMPPTSPHYDVVESSNIDPEHMLELGTIIKDAAGNITLTDDKEPWLMDALDGLIGDPEIDGPATVGSKQPPYLLKLKKNETFDIGWAVDFHRICGNQLDYDIRLSCSQSGLIQGFVDENLYINNRPILTTANPDPLDLTYLDPQDGTNGGDKFTPIHSNFRVVDSSSYRDGFQSEASNSGFANLELCTYHPGTGNSSDPWADFAHGAKFDVDHSTYEASLSNYYNFDDPSTVINKLKLGNTAGDVTINGDLVLTENNFGDLTDTLIFFLGKFAVAPITRADGTAPTDGDQYYNTTEHTYYYWNSEYGAWTPLGDNGGGIDTRQYTFTVDDVSRLVYVCDLNPEYTMVTLNGVELRPSTNLIAGEYTASDTQITLANNPDIDDIIIVHTALDGGSGVARQFTQVMAAGADKIYFSHNPLYVIVTQNGVELRPATEYTTDGFTITLDVPANVDDVIVVHTILDTELSSGGGGITPIGNTEYVQTELVGDGSTVAFGVNYNPAYVMVSLSGVQLSNTDYNATDGTSIVFLNGAPSAGQLISVNSVGTLPTTPPTTPVATGVAQTTDFVAGAHQEHFIVSNAVFTQAAVYLNGIRLRTSSDYNITTSGGNSTIKLTFSATLSDLVTADYYDDANIETVNFTAITGTYPQIDFVINNKIWEYPKVYVAGIRNRINVDYTVANNGTDTTITFTTGKADGTWVAIDAG